MRYTKNLTEVKNYLRRAPSLVSSTVGDLFDHVNWSHLTPIWLAVELVSHPMRFSRAQFPDCKLVGMNVHFDRVSQRKRKFLVELGLREV
jgi:hypothetical protein